MILPDVDMLDITIKEAYSVGVAIPNNHNLYREAPKVYRPKTIPNKNMATERGLCTSSTNSNIHNGYYSKQITRQFKAG